MHNFAVHKGTPKLCFKHGKIGFNFRIADNLIVTVLNLNDKDGLDSLILSFFFAILRPLLRFALPTCNRALKHRHIGIDGDFGIVNHNTVFKQPGITHIFGLDNHFEFGGLGILDQLMKTLRGSGNANHKGHFA